MTELNAWIQPLLLLPGVGLLIMGAAHRSAQLNDEYHRLSLAPQSASGDTIRMLLQRAALFRNALVSLYVAAALLALAALLGGLTLAVNPMLGERISLVAGSLAVAAIVFATVELIRESILSNHLIRERCMKLAARGESD